MEPAHTLAGAGPFGLYRASAAPHVWLSAVNRERVPIALYRVPRVQLLQLAAERNLPQLVELLGRRLASYHDGQPFRESPVEASP